jgi:hypothetical protein
MEKETSQIIIDKLDELKTFNASSLKGVYAQLAEQNTKIEKHIAEDTAVTKNNSIRLSHIETVLQGEDGTNGMISKVNFLHKIFYISFGSSGGVALLWAIFKYLVGQT